MDIKNIQEILIEHSNAMQALFQAAKLTEEQGETFLKRAVKHMRRCRTLQTTYDPAHLPTGLSEDIDLAIRNLEQGRIDDAREVLLRIGRGFDDLRNR